MIKAQDLKELAQQPAQYTALEQALLREVQLNDRYQIRGLSSAELAALTTAGYRIELQVAEWEHPHNGELNYTQTYTISGWSDFT